MKLVAGFVPSPLGEPTQVVERRAYPDDRLGRRLGQRRKYTQLRIAIKRESHGNEYFHSDTNRDAEVGGMVVGHTRGWMPGNQSFTVSVTVFRHPGV
jgi:hypothetical protein